ncbi:MAG: hypothetical protein KY476_26955, partial [Planctomycetes bacterium]|nr:hypothetical protein [Planctomycetota bacterium]
VMTAACLAEGVTTIEAAACEPEIVDLGNFLNAAGARITGLGTPFLRIEGVERLSGVEHTVIPDRIEAATLLIAAAATRSTIELENIRPDHLTAVLELLREIGMVFDEPCATGEREASASRLFPPGKTLHSQRTHRPADAGRSPVGVAPGNCRTLRARADGALRPVDCIALPYPGIPTDVQAQMMALLTTVEGISVITDRVFPDRFLHAPELVRLGAKIRREGPHAVISGVARLSGACVMASDLRASAALVIAALAAEGPSVIRRIYHLDRGYEKLETKLSALGGDVRRVDDEPANMPASLVPAAIGSSEDAASSLPPLTGPKWLTRPARARVTR